MFNLEDFIKYIMGGGEPSLYPPLIGGGDAGANIIGMLMGTQPNPADLVGANIVGRAPLAPRADASLRDGASIPMRQDLGARSAVPMRDTISVPPIIQQLITAPRQKVGGLFPTQGLPYGW